MSAPSVKKIQTILGTQPDDIWGTKLQKALKAEIGRTAGQGNPPFAKIQKLLGIKADGFWGPVSQPVLNDELDGDGCATIGIGGTGFKAEASSFADSADVKAFEKCKATGKTDQSCFKVGDNGIGQFGKITAQTHTPMVAIHQDDMIAKWGSVNAAAHRVVNITINGKTIQAAVVDRLSVAGRIDLDPAAAKQLGLNPPFLVKNCIWSWA